MNILKGFNNKKKRLERFKCIIVRIVQRISENETNSYYVIREAIDRLVGLNYYHLKVIRVYRIDDNSLEVFIGLKGMIINNFTVSV